MESDSNNILINDSCILFDLVDLNLLDDFFQLEFSYYTTSSVIEEVVDDSQMSLIKAYISKNKLIVDNQGLLESIESIYDLYPSLSFTDSSVLELTKRKKGILLSSDKSLRKISKQNGINVKGLLWVIRNLVEMNVISSEKAIERLNLYPQINVRAPIKEIKKCKQELMNLK